ncbi:MAG: helix-turn-helix domain-containing protein [Yaniella sp.]|uniref:hypothetical protein n=1 Tax=Yaniella sp. TaxID=2773929 RepID=UPI002649CCF7|nr:hypothetical protein [Yaniella sp.]MDN6456028.1 helix-turn-helix domain-containing protein [Yaniella sp.]MDN6489517.1 helix-turn-helix domain-containing protein [Yaniella sp.]MDN6636842.1 helix-turn-helix domain-containing protein [Yaniella sp.]
MSIATSTWAKQVSHEIAKAYEQSAAEATTHGEELPGNKFLGAPAFILSVLADYADETWQCKPSLHLLSRDTGGYPHAEIIRAIGILEELELISFCTTAPEQRGITVFHLKESTLQNLQDHRRHKLLGLDRDQNRTHRGQKEQGDPLKATRQEGPVESKECGS